MKRSVSFICGFLAGSILLGGGAACAAGIIAERTAQHIFVDGKETQFEAYLIDGHNYLQLRDIGQAVGFNVWWDEQTRTVQIDSSQPYTGVAPEAPATERAGEQNTEDFNAAVLTGAYTKEAFGALRSAIVTGVGSEPTYMSEETHQAMLEAEAAIGCWPVYDLESPGRQDGPGESEADGVLRLRQDRVCQFGLLLAPHGSDLRFDPERRVHELRPLLQILVRLGRHPLYIRPQREPSMEPGIHRRPMVACGRNRRGCLRS